MDKQNVNGEVPDAAFLIEHMADGFAYCKMQFENGRPCDFTYLMVNPAFEKITGLNGVVNKNVTEVIPGIKENNPELFEIYGRVALTGSPDSFESYVAYSATIRPPSPRTFGHLFHEYPATDSMSIRPPIPR